MEDLEDREDLEGRGEDLEGQGEDQAGVLDPGDQAGGVLDSEDRDGDQDLEAPASSVGLLMILNVFDFTAYPACAVAGCYKIASVDPAALTEVLVVAPLHFDPLILLF
ncbi:hypothetical protein L1049_005352 [Liquidambar formosana]|uniref:Uncharacterized protein n=1 Tax=Liquidambar formosana TaxID=63359 RepID=A0AAP0RQM9_LIQFO